MQSEVLEICKNVAYCPNLKAGDSTSLDQRSVMGWVNNDIDDSGLAKLYHMLMHLQRQEALLIHSEEGTYWNYTQFENKKWAIQEIFNIKNHSHFYQNLSDDEFKPSFTAFLMPKCDTMEFNYLMKRGWIIDSKE